MGINTNTPTLSYIQWKDLLITYNDTIYQIQNSYTNKSYIYWDANDPYKLITSNVLLKEKVGVYYIFFNQNGMYTQVPQTDIQISFSDGDSKDLIAQQIIAFGEQQSINNEKFATLEMDIDGIKTSVGEIEEDINGTKQTISEIDQKADSISLSVSTLEREYADNEELRKLRDDTNTALLKLQSSLGLFNSDMNTYMEDNKLSDEERNNIKSYKEIITEAKEELNKQINEVIKFLTSNGKTTESKTLTTQQTSLNDAFSNLFTNIDTSIADNVFTNTEMATITTYFSTANTKINETNNMIDEFIFLGSSGKIVKKISEIVVEQDEIRLGVKEETKEMKDDINKTIDNKVSELTIRQDEIKAEVKQEMTKVENNINKTIETRVGELTIRQDEIKAEVKQEMTKVENNTNNKINSAKTELSTKITTIENRVSSAEQKITKDAITNTVKDTFYTKTEVDGKINVTVKNVDVKYYLSTSSTTIMGGSWQTTAPTWQEGKYIWTKTVTTYSNGSTTETKPVCITGTGAKGTGITSITEEYYLSTSKTTQTGGSWQSTPPTWSVGKYIWTRSKIVYNNPTSTQYTTPICDTAWEAINDMEIGGRNLIYNSAFLNGTTAWVFATNVTLDKTRTLNGHPSCKSSQSGLLSDSWRGCINYFLPTQNSGKFKAGDKFTISCWYYVENKSTFDDIIALEMKGKTPGSTSETGLGSISIPVSDIVVGKWTKLVKNITLSTDVTACCIRAWVRKNGTAWFTDFKLERGIKATDWTPSPEDIQIEIETTKETIAKHETSLNSITSRVATTENSVTKINGEITNVTNRVSAAEQKITDSAITNVVSKNFYTKSQTDTQISSGVSTVQQTVNSWSAKIEQNGKDIASLKLTDEEFDVTLKSKADSSNIISKINASTEGITISSSKVNISGLVKFTDLSTSGETTINGSNITTGTIDASKATITNINASNIKTGTLDASKVTVTNLNASNIKTGTLSGNLIQGGTIKGATLQTYADSTSKGVVINKESMYLNGTKFLYKTSDNFRIASDQTLTLSSPKDIYLLAGLSSNDSQTGTNTVIIPEATLRTQKLTVVNGASFQQTVSIGGTLSCGTISSVSNFTTTAQVKCSTLYVSSTSILSGTVSLGGSLNATSGTITANNLKANNNVNCVGLGVSGDMSVSKNAYIKYLYVNGTWVSSDKRKKMDIKYVDKDTQTIGESGLIAPNVNINKNDMHEFIEALPIASYRYIDDVEKERDVTHYGLVVQDVLYTKVGSELVKVLDDEKQIGDEEDYMGYSQEKLLTFMCGALQKEIEYRKELEERVKFLEDKCNK